MQIFFTETESDTEEFFSSELRKVGLEAVFVRTAEEVDGSVEILSTFIYTRIDKAFIDAHPRLRRIATRSVTTHHIDLEACRRRRVSVSTVPQYGENTVAEHTFALLLALTRRIRPAIEATRRSSIPHSELRGIDLAGRTLGVIGAGRVGLTVIRIARAFQMEVLAHDVNPNDEAAATLGFRFAGMKDLLRGSDVLTLHTPLTPGTHHLLNASAFSLCKDGTILINTANGNLVDTKALLKALDSGKVAAAGLDVLEEEMVLQRDSAKIIGEQIIRNLQAASTPEELKRVSPDRMRELQNLYVNKALISRSNVIVTPHVAYNSEQTSEHINRSTLESILDEAARAAARTS